MNRDFEIIRYSENLSDILETSITQLVESSIFNFLISIDNTCNTRDLLTHKKELYKKMIWRAPSGDIQVFINLYQYPEKIMLEIERITEYFRVFEEAFDFTNCIMTIMSNDANSLNELAQISCQNILEMLDYDRVIVYKFDELDLSGQVVGEARKEGMESYEDMHFLPNDIPLSVRAIYSKIKMRYVPNILAQPIKIVALTRLIKEDNDDISALNLRMVAPVHVQYVQNMGLLSTTSIAIFKNKKLWGIISCHNKQPKYLPLSARLFLLLCAKTLSTQISALEYKKTLHEESKLTDIKSSLAFRFSQAGKTNDALAECYEDILHLTDSTGMSSYFQGILSNYGETPEEEQIFKLLDWIKDNKNSNLYLTSQLSLEYESSVAYKDKASGLLVIKDNSLNDLYLLFYRPERLKTITWSGNPDEITPNNLAEYSPKNSFKSYLKTIINQSKSWTIQDTKAAELVLSYIVSMHLKVSLQFSATHDPLTQLFNRFSLEQILTQEINRATRQNQSLAILLVDIDYFKKINDTFGHLAGDEVLVSFAKLLKACLRGYDYIFRYGGEEFLIILTGLDFYNAKKKAEFILNRIKNHKILFNHSTLPPVTVSIGISMLSEACADSKKLIEAADEALYQAKTQGRDQCVGKSP